MSALPQEFDADHVGHDETIVAGGPVVVRRRAGLAALIGAGASAVAIAYLWRASQTMTALDWGLCVAMAGIAAIYLANLVDSRTPLLVVDDLGVRIRLGREWRGLPWEGVERVVVHPRRGLLRDGRIVLAPHSLARTLDGLDAKGRRRAGLNQKMYGAPLAVPVGITTRVSTRGERTVLEEIVALAQGRARVVEELVPEAEAPVAAASASQAPPTPMEPGSQADPAPSPSADPSTADHEPADDQAMSLTAGDEDPDDDPNEARPVRRSILGGIGTIVSRVAKGRQHDVDLDGSRTSVEPAALLGKDDPADDADLPDTSGSRARGISVPLRATRPALRAEITRDLPATLDNALHHGAEGARVRPISKLGDAVQPLVVGGFVTEPAYDPVIGPELAAARNRVGLSVDDLAERTRIRPHVIESIEVDDFAPCGGDVYARGHLRTLARVLGKDVVPMLETFDARYATAPVNARRVFEAELATGMTGSMRSTISGPNWGLLVGVVIGLVLVWGMVRLLAGEPAELIQSPAPVLNGSVHLDAHPDSDEPAPATESLKIMLTAAYGDTAVVVRDGNGKITFSREMVLGEKRRLEVSPPPATVRAVDAGAIEVTVHGRDRGVLGELGRPGRHTFR